MNTKWKVATSFLLGVVLGFVFSPIKRGVRVEVKNNGNYDKENT